MVGCATATYVLNGYGLGYGGYGSYGGYGLGWGNSLGYGYGHGYGLGYTSYIPTTTTYYVPRTYVRKVIGYRGLGYGGYGYGLGHSYGGLGYRTLGYGLGRSYLGGVGYKTLGYGLGRSYVGGLGYRTLGYGLGRSYGYNKYLSSRLGYGRSLYGLGGLGYGHGYGYGLGYLKKKWGINFSKWTTFLLNTFKLSICVKFSQKLFKILWLLSKFKINNKWVLNWKYVKTLWKLIIILLIAINSPINYPATKIVYFQLFWSMNVCKSVKVNDSTEININLFLIDQTFVLNTSLIRR